MPLTVRLGSRSPLWLSLATAIALTMTGCSGCGGKGKSRSGGGGGEIPEPSPTPEPSPSPSNNKMGDETRPIEPDRIETIDTENAAAVIHLPFRSTDKIEGGRYLSEYLIAIRAKETSCVRFKVRPTSGISAEVNEEALKDSLKGRAACEGQVAAGEQEPGPTPEPSAATDSEQPAATALTGFDGATSDKGLANLAWATDEARSARGLALAPSSAAICAPRLFRMETVKPSGDEGIEPVVSKIGLLRVVGTRVRIWLDEEYTPACSNVSAGTTASPKFAFGPLVQSHASDRYYDDGDWVYRDITAAWRDALYIDHLQNLAAELDKIVDRMTGTYGPFSDIDDSGFVEVFLTPDVNRKYFSGQETHAIDHFSAGLIYKPEDLAFYDGETNPTSNEGEIIYLWTPDPAGIYSQREFPSANSLTSNYAKGYAASQAMTLIVANQRLLQQKQKGIPDPWLLQSLSLLASAYYGGNDYSWRSLAQYLTSRPQYISLLDGPDGTMISERYAAMGSEESQGMRTMFGWYLHARLCGSDTVAPCAALKQLITTSKNGIEAVEELTGRAFKDLMANFALSVGISLVERPAEALARWDVVPKPEGLPEKPTVLPDFLQIFADDPPTTVEAKTDGNLVSLSNVDRTVASPFPSKKMLIYQTLAADNDMEFKITANSVAYIMVTGLIDQITDVTAYFGKGLNVVFIPLGDRDPAQRALHIEKLSELAHADMRPENLSSQDSTTMPHTTVAYDRVYPGLDLSVTPSRELWTLGSIDNFAINVQGALTTIDDADTYEIEFQPCAGLAGSALTVCQSSDHDAIVQVVIRDFDKELAPMLIVTDTDRKIFRGHSVYDRLVEKDKLFVNDASNVLDVICPAARAWPDYEISFPDALPSTNLVKAGGGTHGLANGQYVGFTAEDGMYNNGALFNFPYRVRDVNGTRFELLDARGNAVTFSGTVASRTYFLNTGSDRTCAAGGFSGKTVYDDSLTVLDPTVYAHNYDNFLTMGPLGFPFTTRGTQMYKDMPICAGYMCFLQVESDRQYFKFNLNDATEPMLYVYWAAPRFISITEKSVPLNPEEIGTLSSIKTRMDTLDSDPDPDKSSQDEAFVNDCASVAGLTIDDCATIISNQSGIEAKIINFLASQERYIVCNPSDSCADALDLLVPGSGANARTWAWLPTTKFFWYKSTTATNLISYYSPVEPFNQDDYCAGDGGVETQFTRCLVKPESVKALDDIRQQFNIPLNMLSLGNCLGAKIGQDFQVCIDLLSSHLELNPNDAFAYWALPFRKTTDRNVVLPVADNLERRESHIMSRAGEIIAKPERLHAVPFRVPGAGKIVNVIVGGRDQSQGKYLLRARLFDPDGD